MAELKTCPFYGGEAEIVGSNATYWIDCNKCRAETGLFNTETEAIEAWNRRSPNDSCTCNN